MVTIVKMPIWGWTMVEGTIVKWLKKEGEEVKKGEPLCEVETEKITTEIEAPEDGILRKIVAPESSVVPIGEVVAFITKPDEELPTSLEEVTKKPEEEVMERRLLSTPAARRLAREHNIDLTRIQGTGPGGRIVKEDVLRVIETGIERVEMKRELLVPSAKVIPIKGMRKAIADRMSQSWRTIPHVTQVMEVDATEIVRLRERLLPQIEKTRNIRITYTDIIAKAVAEALEKHPMINSLLIDQEIHVMDDINVGVAVNLEEGLIVPVVRNANKKSLIEIAQVLNELIQKARKSKLSLYDVSDGTFTITNIGVFGISINTPIINPPQTAILGVGQLSEKPAIANGQIVIRSLMNLNLSYDHRAHDGATVARFLQTLKELLENPLLLLTEEPEVR